MTTLPADSLIDKNGAIISDYRGKGSGGLPFGKIKEFVATANQ